MSPKLAFAAAVFAFAAAVGPVSAQSVSPSAPSALQPFPITGTSRTAPAGDDSVKISVSYQFFLEGETDTMEEQAKLADQGRKHLYQLLANECVVLKQTIAATCAIERANVNAQLRDGQRRRQAGVRISGSATYRISLTQDDGARHDKKDD
jgi:hypothetical protein